MAGGGRIIPGDTSSLYGVQLTAGGSAHTKGSWVLVQSGHSSACMGVLVYAAINSATVSYLFDLGVGGSGSEKVLLSNFAGMSGSNTGYTGAWFPIMIPPNRDLRARVQASTGSSTARIHTVLNAMSWMTTPALGRCVTVGANTGSSRGTNVDPGGTADTKGSWTSFGTITTPVKAVVFSFLTGGGSRTDNWKLVDFGADADGGTTYQTVIPNMFLADDLSYNTVQPSLLGPFPVDIPSGARLACRAQSSITTAGDRTIDAILHLLS